MRYLILLLLSLSFTSSLRSQWSGKIINSKYDGKYGYAQVKLNSLESSKNLYLRMEVDLSQVNPAISFMLTNGFFCDEYIDVKFQIDSGDEIKEFWLEGEPFDGKEKLYFGEYTTSNLEELFNSLRKGKEGRITVYNSHCGTTKYALNLNGSNAKIGRVLKEYRDMERQVARKVESEINISTGDTVIVKPNVGLYSLNEEFGYLNRTLYNYFPEGVYTGKYHHQWEEVYFEIYFEGQKYYVVSFVIEPKGEKE